MSRPSAVITVPEVKARFEVYRLNNPSWGSLHTVLEDNNVKDDHVQSCIRYALEEGDQEGVELGNILLKMSKSQRLKLGQL